MAVKNRRLGDIAGLEEMVFMVSILSLFGPFRNQSSIRDRVERLRFRQSPDNLVNFQVVLRNFLTHRDEASLLERDPVLDQILRLPARPR